MYQMMPLKKKYLMRSPLHRNRGFDVYGFDDGDYEEISMTKMERMIFDDSTIS